MSATLWDVASKAKNHWAVEDLAPYCDAVRKEIELGDQPESWPHGDQRTGAISTNDGMELDDVPLEERLRQSRSTNGSNR